MQIRKILFPTDFSETANLALAHALYLAEKYDAELHMLHVVVLHAEDPHNPAHHFPDEREIHEKLRDLAQKRMDEATVEYAAKDLSIRHVQRRSVSAAPAIVEYAEEEDIDLVVMGTHGRRGIRHLLIGSVAEEVVRLAPCPVLSVHGAKARKPLSAMTHVLAPVDFSEHSKVALQTARHTAASYEADLQILHVLENVIHPAFYNMGAVSIKDLQPDIEERSKAAMLELFEETDGPDVRTEYFTREGHAARTIVRFAQEQDTDLIVISTHGLTGVEHFLLGSVAEKVVRRAACPVLVVKAFERAPASG